MPKITVITPTYNRADLISQTIESILNQTFTDFEYFILDDGSTDNTEEVVQKYLTDTRVKYLKHENQGEAGTANWGWSLASGEYFTQINSDDTISPILFEEMVKLLDANPDKILAYPDFYFIDENNNITLETKSPDWDFHEALSRFSCYADAVGTFIRKSVFKDWKKLRESDKLYFNLTQMYWDMALAGDFIHLAKPLGNWRRHSGQISNTRYHSIPEIAEWFNYFFSKPDLPQEILDLKERTQNTIFCYFHSLIDQSEFAPPPQTEEKSEKETPSTNKYFKRPTKFSKLIYKYILRPPLKSLFGRGNVKIYFDKIIGVK